jgi:hypothetical protein
MFTNRNRRLEPIISVLLLIILLLIGLGVFIKQFDFNMGQFGIGADLLLQQQGETTKIEPDFEIHAPDGFKKLSEIELYNPDNLYEKINGKAPLYTESGFVKLATQSFISNDDESLWLEINIFNMVNVRNAFSVYSIQRRPDAMVWRTWDPRYTYKTSNSLYFICSQYYVEIVGSTGSQNLFRAIEEIAEDLKVALKGDKKVSDIAELALFPVANIVEGSAKLYLANAFGFAGFTDVFTCRYELNGELITAFLSNRSDMRNAQATADSYYKFLKENNAQSQETDNQILKDHGVHVLDFYGTTEIVFSIGSFVSGIHEADERQVAEEIATRLIERLGRHQKRLNNDGEK